MSSIVLATLNARYHHCSFGLRYLLANMGHLRDQTELVEFTINQPTLEILDAILAKQPRIVGLGIYIWNVDETLRLVSDLKRVAPDVIVILGGPEVSYESEQQLICQVADYIITGEADLAFQVLCNDLLREPMRDALTTLPCGGSELAKSKLIYAAVPDLNRLMLPYDLYSNEDIANRVIYVEASRGCPFTCEFCLSALDIPVRQFSLEPFLSVMDQLLERGARTFKFVDRTFNLNIRTSRAIMQFFLERYQPGMFLHFELIPDRLPDALKDIIVQFPAGALQFEVGIQTFNNEVSDLISRRQDNFQVEQNLRWLKDHTSVHVHADLIVGLPGESLVSFGAGFDRLIELGPHEIQVGILKRLRGTPIIRHDDAWQMVYSPHPPYEILQTSLLNFSTVQVLRRFSKYWDTIANSGNFVETTPMLWHNNKSQLDAHSYDFRTDASGASTSGSRIEASTKCEENGSSPFHAFLTFSNWLYARESHSHGISLSRLVEILFQYLTQELAFPPQQVARVMWRDYQRGGRSDKPICLRPYLSDATETTRSLVQATTPKRQSRRLGLVEES